MWQQNRKYDLLSTFSITEYFVFLVVKSVCAKRDHVIDGKAVAVSPYFRCKLGEVWDADLHKFPLPDPIVVPLTDAVASLLQK